MSHEQMNYELDIIQVDDLNWIGKVGGERICEFNYFRDTSGVVWVNNISTIEDFQRYGFGTLMIEAAIQYYGEIHVSTAEKHEVKQSSLKGDLRYNNYFSFEESPIGKFSKKLLEKGLIRDTWIRNPFRIE